MIVVVDASTAAMWFLPEPESATAALLLDANCDLVAPELMQIEVGSALLKAVRRGAIAAEDAADALLRLTQAPVHFEPIARLTDAAFHMANRYGGSIYDAVYIAQALSHDAVLATNDRELAGTAHMAHAQAWLLADPAPAELIA